MKISLDSNLERNVMWSAVSRVNLFKIVLFWEKGIPLRHFGILGVFLKKCHALGWNVVEPALLQLLKMDMARNFTYQKRTFGTRRCWSKTMGKI